MLLSTSPNVRFAITQKHRFRHPSNRGAFDEVGNNFGREVSDIIRINGFVSLRRDKIAGRIDDRRIKLPARGTVTGVVKE